jgi:ketosteroid isomerase-like protein
VRAAFAAVFVDLPDIRFSDDTHFVSGDRGLSEWVLSGTDAEDGTAVEVKGCDIFTFRDGKIALKDSYLK